MKKTLIKSAIGSLAIGVIVVIILSVTSKYDTISSILIGIIAVSALFIISLLLIISRDVSHQKSELKKLEKRVIGSGTSGWFERTLQPELALPLYSGWELHPETRSYLIKDILEKTPENVVEVGSGISTLLTAYALEINGKGFIWSLEHDRAFAESTQSMLRAHKLEHRVKIITVDLTKLNLENWNGYWYDTEVINKVLPESIDYLTVDAPPQKTGELARYPAVPVLSERLSESAVILLDDAKRDDEVKITQRWQEEGFTKNACNYDIGNGLSVSGKRSKN